MPASATGQKLKDAFGPTGEIKGIWVRFQDSHGVVVLAFFDIRHAIRAQRQITSQTFPGLDDVRLDAGFVSAEQLEMVRLLICFAQVTIFYMQLVSFQLTGKSSFVDETDGGLFITVKHFQPAALQNVLSSFGELRSFEITDPHEAVSAVHDSFGVHWQLTFALCRPADVPCRVLRRARCR